MARRESYAQLKFRAEAAEKREDYRRQQRIANPAPYKNRPARASAYYNSYLKDGVLFQVNYVIQNANALISGTPSNAAIATADYAKLGLFETPPAGKTPINISGTGSKPAMLKWFNGKSTPTVRTTPWGTRVVSFSNKTGSGDDAQSHRSCPVGDVSSPVTFDAISLVAIALLTPSSKKAQIIGEAGQITLLPEIGNVQL